MSRKARVRLAGMGQRLKALFLCLLIVAGAVVPTASAYAATETSNAAAAAARAIQEQLPQTVPAADGHAAGKPVMTAAPHKAPAPDTKTKMKQNYAGALPNKDVGFTAAETGNLSAANFQKPDATVHVESIDEAMKKQPVPLDPSKRIEVVEKRGANKEVFRNNNGSFTEKQYLQPKFYQKDGQWKPIDASLIEDKNAGDSGNIFGRLLGQAQSALDGEQAFTVKENGWVARFSPSDFEDGMVRIKMGSEQVGFAPVNAKRVAPVVTTDERGRQTVHYYDLWPGVNVEYNVLTGELKENIILKDKNATTNYGFKIVGARLAPQPQLPGGFKIQGAFGDTFNIMPLNLTLNIYGPVEQQVYRQEYKNDQLNVSIDKSYLASLPADAFPVTLDPSASPTISGNHINFKSDGYTCNSSVCSSLYAGSLNDGSAWRQWRTAFNVSYTSLTADTELLDAYLVLGQDGGTVGSRSFQAFHAVCLNSFNCVNSGLNGPANSFDASGALDVTNIYRTLVNNNDHSGWLMLLGQECGCQSFKSFDSGAYVQFDYNNHPSIPAVDAPTDGSTVITTQPIMGVAKAADADGDIIKYGFQLRSTNGVVLYQTTWLNQNHITIPEGLLQDGGSYVWSFALWDEGGYWNSGWRNGGTFTVDLRTGKDKTSTYDTVGPVSVSLNNGNVFTSVSSHSMGALAGSIGLGLDYNSPYASRMGLRAEYYDNQTRAGDPSIRRTEANVDNDWSTGSPAEGVIHNDHFSAHYSGKFIAPVTGAYYFGATHDDDVAITVDSQQVYSSGGCYTGPCYGNTINLTAGQVVPFSADYTEVSGPAYVRLYVKGAVPQTVIKSEWLRTDPMPTEQASGLTGHYYKDNGSHDPAQMTEQIMVRQDPAINFQWGENAPVPGTDADGFYVRWEGYFIPAANGNYTFGAKADDGFKITINGQVAAQNWANGAFDLIYGTSSVALTKNTPVPITVEYYEAALGAYMQLYAITPYDSAGSIVESQYLTPGGKVLPPGWSLSVDADGNLVYERLQVRQNGDAVLYDADGSSHLFANTGGGFKPPVNEDATLIRNADSSYTLTDADGRMYTFNVDGTLRETTTPIDDRHPAALRYNYATQNGMPKLTEIVDGVDTSRKGNVYYAGDSQCATPPGSFIATPANYLCAFITTDGQRTDFFYKTHDDLAEVSTPGNAKYDFGYSTDSSTYHTLTSIRDVLANDAVAAGVRADDATANTEIVYDTLARATSITAPAPQASATRSVQTIDYLPGAPDDSYAGAAKRHVSGDAEPNGYSQYIEYDKLLRTTKACDNAALCTTSEWDAAKDLALSATDPTGLKSTTIYDDEDRPTDSYGPAPSSYYGTDRKPTSTYVNTVPHTETKFDEGISGPAVAWYNFKDTSGKGVLFGAPKLHATGLGSSGGSGVFESTSAPITKDTGMDGVGFSATGKLRVTQTGSFTFTLDHDDAARLWINDNLVIDRWSYRSDTPEANGYTMTLETGKAYRFRLDYANVGTTSHIIAHLSGPGRTGSTSNWDGYLSPDYSLATTTKVYDSTLGNSTATTNYGSTPELGLPQSAAVDPTGLNLTTASTYESPGATGSYLRQTAKYLPGANTAVASTGTQYAYYGATETKDNPCTTGTTEAYKQAGMLKLKTEPDPDGTASQTPRTIETIYDDSGKAVATRYNSDSWTCMYYDTRGRSTDTTIPAFGSASSRTIQHNYATSGNPLVTAVGDNQGWITVTSDLLRRTTKYIDAYGDVTNYEYNAVGNLSRKYGDLGDKVFNYDNLNRPTTYVFDSTTYATVHYDSYGRTDYIDYNNAGQMRVTPSRDAFGRTTTLTYRLGNGTTTVSDTIGLTQSGRTNSDTVTSGSTTYSWAYGYDAAGRLTSAATSGSVGTNTYTYGFGTQNTTTCGTGIGTNANSGKSSNRTTQTVNGVTTTFCYDYADKLTGSSDSLYSSPTYDSHGSMSSIGTGATPLHLYYDPSGRNWALEQYDASGTGVGMYYGRDPQGRIMVRTKNTITNWNWADVGDYFYGFTDSNSAPDLVRDPTWNILEKYLQLPGGVLLTITPSQSGNAQKQYSLPNLHGDTFLTTDAAGTNTSNGNGPASSFTYDPFGNKLPGSVLPTNANQASFAYAGKYQKFTETNFTLIPMQMGARVYLPTLGRFAQVDPIEGGTPNSYVYPGDPVNESDYSGLSLLSNLFRVAAGVASVVAGGTAILGVAACIATVVCGAAAGATLLGAASASVAFGSIAVTGRSNNPVGAWAGLAAGLGLSVVSPSSSSKLTVSSGYKSSLSIGQAAHREFSSMVQAQGGVANQAVFQGSRLRPDGYFAATNVTQELKPGNPQGVSRGSTQLQGYTGLSGGQGELWLYNQNTDGSFNFWQY